MNTKLRSLATKVIGEELAVLQYNAEAMH